MRRPLSSCVWEQVRSASTVTLRLLGGEAGGELGSVTCVFLSTAPLASEDATSFTRWALTAAVMMSLTGGSSLFCVDDGSFNGVFFTFGTGFSPDLRLIVLRSTGFRSSLGSGALAGGNLRWSAEA